MLSVVVINWNQRDRIQRCLSTVQADEVVVVDNGSTDGSVETIRRDFPDVVLVQNDRNEGPGRARNQGFDISSGEVVAMLDGDTYLEDDVLGNLCSYLEDNPDVSMVGPKLCWPDGRVQHSAMRAMTIRGSLLENLWLYRLFPKERRPGMLLGGYWEGGETDADWLVAACFAIRREAYPRFNTELFPEDSEFGIRLSRSGHRIVYAPQLGTVFHDPSPMTAEKVRMHHKAGVRAYRELHGPVLAGFYRAAQLFGMALRWGVYSVVSLGRDGYFAEQRDRYRELVRAYL